ncbi:MAG TPA: hypothetical protein VEP73_06930 [Actinomycetota bacterium]|nr:hypothetical protein [Actinomycetota bacterium]
MSEDPTQELPFPGQRPSGRAPRQPRSGKVWRSVLALALAASFAVATAAVVMAQAHKPAPVAGPVALAGQTAPTTNQTAERAAILPVPSSNPGKVAQCAARDARERADDVRDAAEEAREATETPAQKLARKRAEDAQKAREDAREAAEDRLCGEYHDPGDVDD